MATAPTPTRRALPRVLRTESRRVYWSFSIATVPALVLQWTLLDRSSFGFLVVCYGLYLLLYSTATVLSFTLDFDGACREHLARSGRWWKRWFQVSGRTEAVVTWSLVALVAATVLAVTGVSRRSAVLAVATVVLVVAAWINVLVSYAAEYARAQHQHGGLEFQGEQPRGYQDYLYFAGAVSTTFGPTDVTVTSRALRRQVLVHSLVAFLFNTVILALLISALLG
jgi:hypothetical protein